MSAMASQITGLTILNRLFRYRSEKTSKLHITGEEKTQKHVLSECMITEEKAKHYEYTKYFTEEDERKLKTMAENNIKIIELMEEL